MKKLRDLLDRHVVGHDEVKRALLLALVCREHVYLEGPPGTAKTRMAELVARGSGLRFFYYQLHRDTRVHELVGDVVLERRPLEGVDGEQIRQRIEPGGVLGCEICLLDDISRAPGEALNVLLRVLNEREFGQQPVPLWTAIATANPQGDDYYTEPLDPANLDRFPLQLRVESLLQSGAHAAVRALVDRYAEGEVAERPEPEAVLEADELRILHARLAEVRVSAVAKEGLLAVLRELVERWDCGEEHALLSDRSFLVKAVKLMRGNALLAGRPEVTREDLAVLRWMTTFRVPQPAHAALPEILARATD